MGVKSGPTGPNGQNVRSVVGEVSPLEVAIAKVVSLVREDARAQPTTNLNAILISYWFKILSIFAKILENFENLEFSKKLRTIKSVPKFMVMIKNQKNVIFQILSQNSNLGLH